MISTQLTSDAPSQPSAAEGSCAGQPSHRTSRGASLKQRFRLFTPVLSTARRVVADHAIAAPLVQRPASVSACSQRPASVSRVQPSPGRHTPRRLWKQYAESPATPGNTIAPSHRYLPSTSSQARSCTSSRCDDHSACTSSDAPLGFSQRSVASSVTGTTHLTSAFPERPCSTQEREELVRALLPERPRSTQDKHETLRLLAETNAATQRRDLQEHELRREKLRRLEQAVQHREQNLEVDMLRACAAFACREVPAFACRDTSGTGFSGTAACSAKAG